MPRTTQYVVQSFVRAPKGNKLEQGRKRLCKGRDEAERLARQLVEQGMAPGAVAFFQVGDAEEDIWDEPRLIACAGSVPPEVRDAM